MNYCECIRRFAKEYGYRQQDVRDFIENMSIFVKDSLVLGENVHLKGFVDFGVYNQRGNKFYDFKRKQPYVSGDRYIPTVKFAETYNQILKAELEKVKRENADGEQTVTETDE